MQLFSSYHILSWAIVSIALIALMGFYVASLRSTVRRQASIIRSMQRQLQNLLASSPVDDGASFRKRSSNGMQIGDVADQALHVLDAEQELFVKTTLYMKEHAPFINRICALMIWQKHCVPIVQPWQTALRNTLLATLLYCSISIIFA